jgi:hypothetical protein
MLVFFSILIMLIVGYAQCREGLFAAVTLLINVILAGIFTFHFWEPLADALDSLFAGGMLAGYEDALVLSILFTIFLIPLRLVSGKLIGKATGLSGYAQQVGGGVFGILTGYLVAGFLVCVLQTLPWHENFLDFTTRVPGEPTLRSFMPPDRVWLAAMRHAGAVPLAWKTHEEDDEPPYDRYQTFDSGGTFELRYLRYRRYSDNREPLRYGGELDRELGKEKTPLNFRKVDQRGRNREEAETR